MKVVLKEWLKRPKLLAMIILEFVCSVVNIVLEIWNVQLFAQIFDTKGSLTVIATFVIVELTDLAINLVQKHSQTTIHHMYTSLNNELADKLIYAEYNMFLEFSCSRVISTTEQLWNISGTMKVLRQMASLGVRVILLIAAIHRILPVLTLPVVIAYALGALILRLMYNKWHAIDKEADSIKRERNKELDEIINGFKEVRGFSTQEYHRGRINGQNRSILGLFLKRNISTLKICASFHILYIISTLCAIAYCVPAVKSGAITTAFAMVVVSYVEQISAPIESLLDFIDELSTRLAHVDEYRKLMAYEDKYVCQTDSLQLTSFDRGITVKEVYFRYGDSETVLQNANMLIPKGKHIGICGVSGGGKTTLLNLLMGYYRPNSGRIEIDGLDYAQIDPMSLRAHIGIVNQDVHIFDDTLLYNIAYSSMWASESQIIEACKRANIWEFIKTLPDGLNTNVGPKGLKLSGGQKQRIGLARVFLADPEIILLDEATSALDNESETLVQEALNAFENKTVVTIAHRLSTIRESDIIYVIDNHTVAEQGTHDELMALNGVYARLNK